MNIYIVVEGEICEVKVYKHWIPLVNPTLTYVDHISEMQEDNFSIISGMGYPQYLGVIEDAIGDINDYGNIDRLVVTVDSEEMSYEEKFNEINGIVSETNCVAEVFIVVQHFCLETWALGNRLIIRKNTQSLKLKEYKTFFDVRINDPELLPGYEAEELNRAQFAFKYLKLALNERYRKLSYTKNNPKALLNDKYFEQVKKRLEDTGHISSFRFFLNAFA
jgi:hypothetical protein